MGVAGGELLIPTIVLLYGIDIKVAGSLSLAVSLPTMLVAFARYSRDQSFAVQVENKTFLLAMAAGSSPERSSVSSSLTSCPASSSSRFSQPSWSCQPSRCGATSSKLPCWLIGCSYIPQAERQPEQSDCVEPTPSRVSR